MPALPSALAVRRAGIAAVVGGGLALVGCAVSGIASMDGTLRSATAQPRLHQVSYDSPPAAGCSHPHWRHVTPAPAAPTT
jgi:hypothetical protein